MAIFQPTLFISKKVKNTIIIITYVWIIFSFVPQISRYVIIIIIMIYIRANTQCYHCCNCFEYYVIPPLLAVRVLAQYSVANKGKFDKRYTWTDVYTFRIVFNGRRKYMSEGQRGNLDWTTLLFHCGFH